MAGAIIGIAAQDWTCFAENSSAPVAPGRLLAKNPECRRTGPQDVWDEVFGVHAAALAGSADLALSREDAL
jgi:hypothetical protein